MASTMTGRLGFPLLTTGIMLTATLMRTCSSGDVSGGGSANLKRRTSSVKRICSSVTLYVGVSHHTRMRGKRK